MWATHFIAAAPMNKGGAGSQLDRPLSSHSRYDRRPAVQELPMRQSRSFWIVIAVCVVAAMPALMQTQRTDDAPQRLIAQILGPSPLEENLRKLTDEIGGRVPGTEANTKGVTWAADAFRNAGVDEVKTESFEMPMFWSEVETRLDVQAASSFRTRAVSMAYSPGTGGQALDARIIDVADGSDAAFARAGATAKGALLLVHTPLLRTWGDLFAEYANARPIISRAVKVGAAGILWMSSREQGLLYRHMNTSGTLDKLPQALLAREDALRISRAIAAGQAVRGKLSIEIRTKPAGPISNVVAEIRGSDKADEIVAIGAHLDSWELGSGALDNGANCALVVEVARAIKAAGIKPRRTLRFLLWNGEEQGLLGSLAYVRAHRNELDRFVVYINFDAGIGRVTGYSLGGRRDLEAGVREALKPVESWGMNQHTLDASSGSDHVDFLLEGVPILDANQEEANYTVNYHASSDTFDKVDMRSLKLHTAYAAVTIHGVANREQRLGRRLARTEIERAMKETGFDQQLKIFGQWEQWEKGDRGRHQ
jgi:carboxypeptidase Q